MCWCFPLEAGELPLNVKWCVKNCVSYSTPFKATICRQLVTGIFSILNNTVAKKQIPGLYKTHYIIHHYVLKTLYVEVNVCNAACKSFTDITLTPWFWSCFFKVKLGIMLLYNQILILSYFSLCNVKGSLVLQSPLWINTQLHNLCRF